LAKGKSVNPGKKCIANGQGQISWVRKIARAINEGRAEMES